MRALLILAFVLGPWLGMRSPASIFAAELDSPASAAATEHPASCHGCCRPDSTPVSPRPTEKKSAPANEQPCHLKICCQPLLGLWIDRPVVATNARETYRLPQSDRCPLGLDARPAVPPPRLTVFA